MSNETSEMRSAQELFNELYAELCDAKDAHYEDYGKGGPTDKMRPYPGQEGGLVTEGYFELARGLSDIRPSIPAGTTLRVVFVSNMGDFGVTANLTKKFGYDFRLNPNDSLMLNCRRAR